MTAPSGQEWAEEKARDLVPENLFWADDSEVAQNRTAALRSRIAAALVEAEARREPEITDLQIRLEVVTNALHANTTTLAAARAEGERAGREATLEMMEKLAEFKSKIGHAGEAKALSLAVSITRHALDDQGKP